MITSHNAIIFATWSGLSEFNQILETRNPEQKVTTFIMHHNNCTIMY